MNIRDENNDFLSSLFGDLTAVVNRVNQLMGGGMRIADVQYQYLASSNSQLRNHSCYFIEDNGTGIAEKIRENMGDLRGQAKV